MEESKNEELNNEEQVNEVSNDESLDTTQSDEISEPKKKSKVLQIAAGILAGIVGIALAGLIVLYLLSPKNRFFNIVSGAFSDISNCVSGFEDSVFGQLLTINTDSKLDIDIKMNGKIETEDEEIKEWVQNLESFELNSKENVDFTNNYSNTTAEFILNGEKFLTGSLVKNKNIISAKLDNITDGYITVNNDKLPALWEKIGYNGPDSLTTQSEMLKILNFSKSDINELKSVIRAFGNGFSTAFEDDDFSFGEGAVKYDEGVIECKTMDFVVEPVKFNNGLIAGFEKITSKEKYIDVLYKLSSAMDRMSGYESLTREEFGTNFEMMVQEIRGIEFSEEDEGFIIRLYYKGNDVLKIDMMSEDYNIKLIELTAVNNKDSGYYKLYDGMMVYEDKVTTIDDVTTHALTIDYINYETGEIDEGYGSEVNIRIDSTNDNEQVINLTEKVRLLSYDEDLENLDIMTIEPTLIRDYTFKGSINGDVNNLEVVMVDSDNSFASTFSIAASVKENAEFEQVTINENENFNVDTATDDELNAKKAKIVENWNNIIGSDNIKLQQFESAVSMYLSMFIPVEYYEEGNYDDVDWESIDLEGLEFEE